MGVEHVHGPAPQKCTAIVSLPWGVLQTISIYSQLNMDGQVHIANSCKKAFVLIAHGGFPEDYLLSQQSFQAQ